MLLKPLQDFNKQEGLKSKILNSSMRLLAAHQIMTAPRLFLCAAKFLIFYLKTELCFAFKIMQARSPLFDLVLFKFFDFKK